MSPVHDPQYSGTRWATIREQEIADDERNTRMEYLKPLAMLAGGMIVVMAAGAIRGAEGTLAYPVWLGFQVVVGVAGLWVAATLFLGGAGPLVLAVIRLAGLYAVSDAVHMVIPLPTLAWLASVTVYLGLLVSLFDFELGEAIIVGLITFALKVITYALITTYLV